MLTEKSRDYQEFAEDYYEEDIPIAAVDAVYAHEPLTGELVSSLNSATSVNALAEDIAQSGYPLE